MTFGNPFNPNKGIIMIVGLFKVVGGAMRHPIYFNTHSSPKQPFFESLERIMEYLCRIILVFPVYFTGCE
jgi:hypothetical protein